MKKRKKSNSRNNPKHPWPIFGSILQILTSELTPWHISRSRMMWMIRHNTNNSRQSALTIPTAQNQNETVVADVLWTRGGTTTTTRTLFRRAAASAVSTASSSSTLAQLATQASATVTDVTSARAFGGHAGARRR